MLLTIRLTSFAYCYSDGQKLKRMQEKDVEELKKHFVQLSFLAQLLYH